MIVRTNMGTLRIYHILNKNDRIKQQSLEALSSGLRLNGTKDGPSDYTIAEKMRVQIRSLDQARRNAENGKSMLRTAERALDATTDIVTRMKEIALEAATDTVSVHDREILQQELAQLAQAVDEIAYHTEFNGIRLLDGSFQKHLQNVSQAAISDMKINSYSQKYYYTSMMVWTTDDGDGCVSILKEPNGNFSIGDTVFMKGFNGGENIAFEFVKDDIAAQNGHVGIQIGKTMEESCHHLVEAIREFSGNTVKLEVKEVDDFEICLVWKGHDESEVEDLFDYRDSGDFFEEAPYGGEYEFDLVENFKSGDSIEIAGHTFVANGTDEYSFVLGETKEESVKNLVEALQKNAEATQIPETFIPVKTQNKNRIYTEVLKILDDLDSRIHICTISSNDRKTISEAVANAVVAGKTTKEIREIMRSQGYTDTEFGGSEVVDGLAFFAQIGQPALFLDNFGYGVAPQIASRPTGTVENKTEFLNASWRASFALLGALGNGASVQEAAKTALEAGDRSYASVHGKSFSDWLHVDLWLNGNHYEQSGEEYLMAMTEKILAQVHEMIPFPDDFSKLQFSAEGNTLHIKERFAKVNQDFIMGKDLSEPKVIVSEENAKPIEKGTSLNLQVGTKSDQTIVMNIHQMNAQTLGIVASPEAARTEATKQYTVDVLTWQTAEKSIDVLDQAVEKIVAEKAKLGAMQNRLEYTAQNLVTANENVASAESVIADADMAKEMLQFQMQKILSQTGQAMIAQAATAPEQVLQLLQ